MPPSTPHSSLSSRVFTARVANHSRRHFSCVAPRRNFDPFTPEGQTEAEIQDEARRLLRSLLREASYLPDSHARAWVKQQIVTRFERRKKNNRKIFEKNKGAPFLRAVILNGFKNAYKALRQLQAANNGDLRLLDKVLRLTYGRTGPYRRKLLEPLLTADPLPDSSAVAEQISPKQRPKTPETSEWTVDTVPVDKVFQHPPEVVNDVVHYVLSPQYSKFKAVVDSQVREKPGRMRGLHLKRASYKMPQKNHWGRMMPRLRVKNLVHGAYAKLLDRVYPPLKHEEWDRLHGLVHGTITGEGYVPRRKRIAERPGTLTSYDLEKLARLDHTALSVEQKEEDEWLNNEDAVEDAKEDLLRDELSIGRRLDKSVKGAKAGHNITPRLMQRMWQRIFETCPKLEPNEERSKWNVIWGSGPVRSDEELNDELAPLFAAVDRRVGKDNKLRKYNILPLRKKDMKPLKPRTNDLAEPA